MIVADYASDFLIALAVVGFVSGLTGYPFAFVVMLGVASCCIYVALTTDEEPQEEPQ